MTYKIDEAKEKGEQKDSTLERGLWITLLVVTVMQIACAIDASRASHGSQMQAAIVHHHGEMTLAK